MLSGFFFRCDRVFDVVVVVYLCLCVVCRVSLWLAVVFVVRGESSCCLLMVVGCCGFLVVFGCLLFVVCGSLLIFGVCCLLFDHCCSLFVDC